MDGLEVKKIPISKLALEIAPKFKKMLEKNLIQTLVDVEVDGKIMQEIREEEVRSFMDIVISNYEYVSKLIVDYTNLDSKKVDDLSLAELEEVLSELYVKNLGEKKLREMMRKIEIVLMNAMNTMNTMTT